MQDHLERLSQQVRMSNRDLRAKIQLPSHFSIRLILVVPNETLSSLHLHRLLDNIFQSLVLVVGLDDLIAQRNVDRIKRDIRVTTLVYFALNNKSQFFHFFSSSPRFV
jgi:hypothetical protein